MKDWVWLLLIGAGLYFLSKSETTGSPSLSGHFTRQRNRAWQDIGT